MAPFETKVRISYADTDQMGFMHQSGYLRYYESARWELFRHAGMPYPDIEREGLLLPVIAVAIRYLKPARFDQMVLIHTTLRSFSGARIIFDYRMAAETGEVLNEAQIKLGCIRKGNGKACALPEHLIRLLQEIMKSQER